jgi:hypothetical protein
MASKGAEQGHLDPAIRNTTLDSFKLFVAATPDAHKVEEWVSESLVRKNILADMAMGTIRWPRSLGRPDVQNLSDGFAIRTKFWVDVWHIGLDGSIVTDIAAFVPGVQPFVRDGVGDPDHFLVVYSFNAVADQDNQVEIDFASVPWHFAGRAANQHRYLSSHGFQFFSGGDFTALPTITIDDRPFFYP